MIGIPKTLSSPTIRILAACCVAAWLIGPIAQPQLKSASPIEDATATQGRSVAAPWRPSFGPVNSHAAATTQSGTGNTGPQQAVDLTPPSSSNIDLQSKNEGGSDTIVPASAQLPVRQRLTPPASLAPPVTRVTRSLETLPNSAGQVWREYDISPYTSQVRSVDNPQQAIIDWILRETGTEMWFNQPLGILNANKNQLRVYHTPEIHNVVKPIIDRFVRTQGQMQSLDLNLVTIGNPNWRSQSYSILQSINVQSPGVEAWLVSKENAALLMNGLSKRSDYRQHSNGRLANHDGQTLTLEKKQPVQFVRNLRWASQGLTRAASATFQPEMTTINEGYKLSISYLSSLDNQTIEASIQCDVDQVEKLNNVNVTVPDAVGNPMQMSLQIPQLVSWRLKERFRWPADQVLLLGCGIVANPDPKTSNGSGLPLFRGRSDRAEALLFIEYRGPTTGASVPVTASDRLAPIERR